MMELPRDNEVREKPQSNVRPTSPFEKYGGNHSYSESCGFYIGFSNAATGIRRRTLRVDASNVINGRGAVDW